MKWQNQRTWMMPELYASIKERESLLENSQRAIEDSSVWDRYIKQHKMMFFDRSERRTASTSSTYLNKALHQKNSGNILRVLLGKIIKSEVSQIRVDTDDIINKPYAMANAL